MNEATVGQAGPDAPPATSPSETLSAPFGSVWAALLWKEWREHRWKLAALVAIGLSVFVQLWWTAKETYTSTTIVIYLVFLLPLFSLFIAIGIAAGEQAAGTIAFTRCLPTPRWRIAWSKLFVAIVTVVVPTSFSLIFDVNYLGEAAFIGLLIVISLMLWCVNLGMNRSDEIRAAAISIVGVVVAWSLFAATAFLIQSGKRPGYERELLGVFSAVLPGGILSKLSGGPADRVSWLLLAPAYLATHGLLLWRWLSGYGAVPRQSGVKIASSVNKQAWLGSPWASPTTAILWKQWRETAPVAIASLALAVGWTTLVFGTNLTNHDSLEGRLADGLYTFANLAALCAMLAALVAGIGLFLEDLRPGVHTFWRSRPISPDSWFWWKYVGGIVCLASFFGAAQAVGILAWYRVERLYYPELWSYIHWTLGFWMVYASAACACCLVRQPIYAAILSISFPCFFYGALGWWMDKLDFSASSTRYGFSVAFIIVGLAATLLAWQAVRRDWAILR